MTEYTRQRERSIDAEGRERTGELAHELRNAVGAATVAFEVLRLGKVGLEGSTAGVLSRSLQRLATLIDTTLTEVRLEAGLQVRERISVRGLIEHIAAASSMEASSRGLAFEIIPCEAGVDAMIDHQLVGAAIANLLQNAFKFTRPATRVVLRASATEQTILIEVEDQSEGFPRERRPTCSDRSSSAAPTGPVWGWACPSAARAWRPTVAGSGCGTCRGPDACSQSSFPERSDGPRGQGGGAGAGRDPRPRGA